MSKFLNKISICILLVLLMVSPVACAAGDDCIYVGVIDSGISSDVIGSEHIAPGRNYVIQGGDTEDTLGHGTGVSAFITGSANGKVEGLCPEAMLVPLVYVTAGEDGTEKYSGAELVARAIYDAVDEFKCDIILVSSGTTEECENLKKAVEYAHNKGVLVIAAAGNVEGASHDVKFYPGAYDSVLCVGSLDEEGNPASFSVNNETVDLFEQGEDLRVITLKGTRIRGKGTSYSAAIVAGKAARLLSDNPKLKPEDIIEELTDASH